MISGSSTYFALFLSVFSLGFLTKFSKKKICYLGVNLVFIGCLLFSLITYREKDDLFEFYAIISRIIFGTGQSLTSIVIYSYVSI